MAEMNALRRLRRVTDPARTAPARPPQAPASPLAEALIAAGQGDEEAFGRFYDLASARIYGIVLRIVRNPTLAEEIAQEVFVEIWRLAPRFDQTRGSAESWSATIAHRRAVDRVRAEQARTEREDRQAGARNRPHDAVVEEVIDSLDRDRVRDALAKLSPQQREAVSLAYYGGHTYRDVAALLDLPEGTAKTRIRDGLINLRDQFGIAP